MGEGACKLLQRAKKYVLPFSIFALCSIVILEHPMVMLLLLKVHLTNLGIVLENSCSESDETMLLPVLANAYRNA